MELNIRQSWSSLSLGEYIKYQSIITNEHKSDFEKKLETVALLSKVEPSILYKVPANQFFRLFESLEFLEYEPDGIIKTEYEIDGRTYRPASKIEDVTTAQFVDLSNFCKDPSKIVENYANILACVLIPVDEEDRPKNKRKQKLEPYLKTDHGQTAKAILDHMPVTEALALASFFTLLLMGYVEVILRLKMSTAEKTA